MEFFDVELLTFGLLDHIAQFQHFQHSNQICSGLAGVGDIAVDLSLGGPGWKARIFHEECDGPVEIPPKGVDSGVDNQPRCAECLILQMPQVTQMLTLIFRFGVLLIIIAHSFSEYQQFLKHFKKIMIWSWVTDL